MGAWGFKPNENDGASDLTSDFIGGLRLKIQAIFNKKAKYSSDRWERLGLLQNLIEAAPCLVFCVKDKALEDIEALHNSAEWLSSWKDPAEVKTQLRKFESKLKKETQDEWFY